MFRGVCLGREIKFAKWNREETLLALLGRLIELGLPPLLKIMVAEDRPHWKLGRLPGLQGPVASISGRPVS